MTLDALKNCRKVVGAKQVRRAISEGRAVKVYLARDAEARICEPIRDLCYSEGIELEDQFDMIALGRAARVEVKASAIAIVN